MYHRCATNAGKTKECVRQTGSSYVSHEWVEGSKGRPSRAESFGRVSTETTDVRPNHGHLVYAGETEDAGDGVPVMFPQTEVVPQPLADVLASTGKRRAGDDEWS